MIKLLKFPPTDQIVSELRITAKQARAMRDLVESDWITAYEDDTGYGRSGHWSHLIVWLMGKLSDVGEFHGAESLYPEQPNIYYLNAGDTYATTLLYDHDEMEFSIGCWGDLMEGA